MPTRDEDLDHELTLPPLDDEPLDDRADEAPVEELLEDDGDAALDRDDTVAADLEDDPSDDLDADGRASDPGDTDTIDVGPLDEDLDAADEHGGTDADGPGMDASDDLDAEPPSGLDDGAEGTSEPVEETVDEAALPDLDDEDEAPGEEVELARELLGESESVLPPWSDARLATIDGVGAVSLPCTSVAVRGGVVIATGRLLLVVDEGASLARIAALLEGPSAVTFAEGEALAVTDQCDATLVSLAPTATPPSRRLRLSSGERPVEVAATSGRIWVSEGGALRSLSMPLGAREDSIVVRDSGVLAIAAAGSTLVALTRTDEGPALERFRGDKEILTRLAPKGRAAVDGASGGARRLLFATGDGGAAVAFARGGLLAVSRDAGASFAERDLGAVFGLAFQGDGADAALLALVGPEGVGPRTGAVIAWPRDGDPVRLAELSIDPDGGAALAWDAAREWIWIATTAGLVAVGRPTRH